MVPYTPNQRKGGKPYIEGEAEVSGTTRKASVGIIGADLPSSGALTTLIPKESFYIQLKAKSS